MDFLRISGMMCVKYMRPDRGEISFLDGSRYISRAHEYPSDQDIMASLETIPSSAKGHIYIHLNFIPYVFWIFVQGIAIHECPCCFYLRNNTI